MPIFQIFWWDILKCKRSNQMAVQWTIRLPWNLLRLICDIKPFLLKLGSKLKKTKFFGNNHFQVETQHNRNWLPRKQQQRQQVVCNIRSSCIHPCCDPLILDVFLFESKTRCKWSGVFLPAKIWQHSAGCSARPAAHGWVWVDIRWETSRVFALFWAAETHPEQFQVVDSKKQKTKTKGAGDVLTAQDPVCPSYVPCPDCTHPLQTGFGPPSVSASALSSAAAEGPSGDEQ